MPTTRHPLRSQQESGPVTEQVRGSFLDLVQQAPEEVKPALLGLLVSVKRGFDAAGGPPPLEQCEAELSTWADLLCLLVALRRAADEAPRGTEATRLARLERRFALLKRSHEKSLLMIEIMFELIDAGQEFQAVRDVVEQSAEVLRHELGADMYVCRLRREDGSWENVAADTADGRSTPIFVHDMEETHPHHPVMRAVHDGSRKVFFVVSNDLRGSEIGGESLDCTPFKVGYRSRLSFILRDAQGKAFGLLLLYDRRDRYFDRFESAFLTDCGRIVSLTVGRRLDVCRDALAKAAGGMAHVGNNVLAIIKNYVEIVMDELEDLRRIYGMEGREGGLMPYEALGVDKKMEYLRQAQLGVDRLRLAIIRLGESVEHPVIMPYIRGEEVLDLEPGLHD
ncbi:hypothetical protein dsx2_2524 [Desulfovibrio sp. X2]|nr:hypothetical protein dsx2_2524 [Desulfovibrio sp. X2]